MATMTLRVAARAVIVKDAKVLIVREADTYEEGTNIGRWVLPGGRINDDEAFYDGLAREVREETGLNVEPIRPVYVGEWWPVIKDVPHHIVGMYIVCLPRATTVVLSDEHNEYAWVNSDEIDQYHIVSPNDQAIRLALNGENG